jgi:hypothetical protein
MNMAIFVIAIAVVATLISTMLQFFMRGREVSPAIKRLLWATFTAGVAALIITFILIVTR